MAVVHMRAGPQWKGHEVNACLPLPERSIRRTTREEKGGGA